MVTWPLGIALFGVLHIVEELPEKGADKTIARGDLS
jgi:hypothetical protein